MLEKYVKKETKNFKIPNVVILKDDENTIARLNNKECKLVFDAFCFIENGIFEIKKDGSIEVEIESLEKTDVGGSFYRTLGKNTEMLDGLWFIDSVERNGRNIKVVFPQHIVQDLENPKKCTAFNIDIINSFYDNGNYGIKLYWMLKTLNNINNKAGSFLVKVEDARNFLVSKEKYQDKYGWGNFKFKALNPSIKEVNNASDIEVTYESKRKGRGGKTYAYVFTINSNKNYKQSSASPSNDSSSLKSGSDKTIDEILSFMDEIQEVIFEEVGCIYKTVDLKKVGDLSNWDTEVVIDAILYCKNTCNELSVESLVDRLCEINLLKNKSNGEMFVYDFLTQNGESFEYNKSFKTVLKDCCHLSISDIERFKQNAGNKIKQQNGISKKINQKYPCSCRYDFVLMHDDKIKGLIEVDGQQHFTYQVEKNWMGGRNKAEYMYEAHSRDRIKTKIIPSALAEIVGYSIPVLRIHYSMLNNETILKEKICEFIKNTSNGPIFLRDSNSDDCVCTEESYYVEFNNNFLQAYGETFVSAS